MALKQPMSPVELHQRSIWEVMFVRLRRLRRKILIPFAPQKQCRDLCLLKIGLNLLIREALKTAKRTHAPAVEAYPIDVGRPGSTANVFTGSASAFRRLRFKTVARREPSRPVMRHNLKALPAEPLSSTNRALIGVTRGSGLTRD